MGLGFAGYNFAKALNDGVTGVTQASELASDFMNSPTGQNVQNLLNNGGKLVGTLADTGANFLGQVNQGLQTGIDWNAFNSYSNAFNSEEARLSREWQHQEALDARTYNSDEARIARDWQERLANTSYQRAVEDLRKAGLNPYLAYEQGGATTPSGASASGSAPSGATASAGSFGLADLLVGVLRMALQSNEATADLVKAVAKGQTAKHNGGGGLMKSPFLRKNFGI